MVDLAGNVSGLVAQSGGNYPTLALGTHALRRFRLTLDLRAGALDLEP